MRKDYCDGCGNEVVGKPFNLSARIESNYKEHWDYFLNLDLCKPCADNGKAEILEIYQSLPTTAIKEEN